MACRRGRGLTTVTGLSRSGIAFVLLLVSSAGRGLALDPTQPFSSYLRTHFTPEDGLSSGVVDDIVQSRDGLLWVITNGQRLARFDGRRFKAILQPSNVTALALAPDGDLWVGTADGLEQIPAAELNQFGPLRAVSYRPGPGASSHITCLQFSRSGLLWVGTSAGLYRFERGVFSSVISSVAIFRIAETSNGRLLVSTSKGIMQWDGSRAAPLPEVAARLGVKADEVFHALEDGRGVTWFCTPLGVARLVGGSLERLPAYGPNGHGAFRAYEDPNGNVWIAKAEGLFRATAAGLELAVPGINVRCMYGDRDGDLWIGTNGDGLFRFKDRAVRMLTTADGLPNNLIMTVLASQDGRIWAGANCGGLSWFDGRRFKTYNERDGLLNSCVWALAEDANHDLWIGTYGGGAFRFRGGRFTQYSKAQGLASDRVTGILPGRDGSVWFATRGGLSRIRDGQIRNYTTADGLSINRPVKLYEGRAGAIWIGTTKGLDRVSGDRFVNVSSVPKTDVYPIGEDRSGALYLALDPPGAVFRYENNVPVIVIPNFEPTGMVETNEGDVWLSGNGILRVPPGGLGRSRRVDEPLDYAAINSTDGLASEQASAGQPNSALSRDGKLWVATPQGLAMLDLPRLPRANRRPAIYMEEVTVGRNVQLPGRQLTLPPGTHHTELKFDAIEISAPEKIRLQYRLDSVDSEWLDTVHPAHAIYSDTPAGTHAFHVRACNRDGIWDRAGMVYNITQQPYFYESTSFRLGTAIAGCLLLAGFYRLRLRQATARLQARLGERVAERERIARDLHDTLLQTFQGLMLHLEVVNQLLPEGKAKAELTKSLGRADRAIAEGRSTVYALRSSMTATSDLPGSIKALGDELSTEGAATFRLVVEGPPREVRTMIRDELYRITREALRNAFRHARARHIEAEIAFGERVLRLRIRDDGEGIPAEIVEKGRPGHYGVPGMRERAKQIGGKLDIWSGAGAGTEIELSLAGSIAYGASPGRSLFRRFGRKRDDL